MKILYLILLLCLCICCTKHKQKEVYELQQICSKVAISSSSFDSLLIIIQKQPINEQVKYAIQIAERNENKANTIQKQKDLLMHFLPFASNRERKSILLRVIELCNKLEVRNTNTIISDIEFNYIHELETNYSLTQEEKWKVKRLKAQLLNRRGKQEEYLPIWFELLKEHRIANIPQYIVDDLLIIANHLSRLGDYNQAISTYEEAYQLIIANQLSNLQNSCLPPLIKLLADNKNYSKALYYYNDAIKHNKEIVTTSPSIQNLLVTCYLGLHKPDSARIVLSERLNGKERNSFFLNCKMSESYIIEGKEDSAIYFINKAIETNPNIKNLPNYSLSTFSYLANLLHKHQKEQQANYYYSMVEPLMKESSQVAPLLERQIEALTSFSHFCRSTKQYKKALELIAHRDSIQQLYNEMQKEKDSKNLADRLEIQELQFNLEKKDTELEYSRHLTYAIIISIMIFIALSPIAFYLIKWKITSSQNKAKKKAPLQETVNNQQDKQQKATVISPSKSIDRPKSPTQQNTTLFAYIHTVVMDHNRFLSKDLSIEFVTKEVKSNRDYVSKAVNMCTGMDFTTWINNLRIDYAIAAIHKEPTLDLGTLSEQCGFKSYATFNRNFKRYKGVTPRAFIANINKAAFSKKYKTAPDKCS
ncbi:AraC family transcriptional regulator [uncultured Phocaeicola sp.]|uniref:helix-turn-helix domain-containing protein n=1 Tax=uncultured Phocaeicola sp. TaxID=990718 RepID=UPI00258A6930|nr:AraC family transcriptional regulator [uncultured Phocaeicola sp.]